MDGAFELEPVTCSVRLLTWEDERHGVEVWRRVLFGVPGEAVVTREGVTWRAEPRGERFVLQRWFLDGPADYEVELGWLNPRFDRLAQPVLVGGVLFVSTAAGSVILVHADTGYTQRFFHCDARRGIWHYARGQEQYERWPSWGYTPSPPDPHFPYR